MLSAIATPNPALAKHYQRQADRLDSASAFVGDVATISYQVLPWFTGIGLGATALASGGIGAGIAGAFMGAVPPILLGLGLFGVSKLLEHHATDNDNLALMASGKVPPMHDAAIPAADGSKLSLGIEGYHGMGNGLNLHVQYFPKGATTPSVDFLTSRAYLDDQVGELHADGRTLEGKRYHVVAAFPQIGLESFSFSQPIAARLTGADGQHDFEDPNPSPGLMRQP